MKLETMARGRGVTVLWWAFLACGPAGSDDAGDDAATEATSGEPTTGEPTTGEPMGCGQSGTAEVAIHGSTDFEGVAFAEAAGDVNGDGTADLVVGAQGAWIDEQTHSSSAVHVVLGPLESAPASLADAPGFQIFGEHGQHLLGEARGIGDVNGDGRDDVIVGATKSCHFDENDICDTDSECPPPTCTAGPYRAYVVFGKDDNVDVELVDVAVGQGGYAIDGEDTEDLQWQEFEALGDLDGDDRADFAIAAPRAGGEQGKLYVVFGKDDGTPQALASVAMGDGGYPIVTADASDLGFPDSIAATGDVDGDGLGDLVVGATEVDEGVGAAYVVFGKGTTEPVELVDVVAGNGGFSIHPEPDFLTPWCCTEFARDVAGPGDVNGDGLADIAVSAPHLSFTNGVPAGRAYVVFGKPDGTAVDLVALGAGNGGGFAIDGSGHMGDWLIAGGGDRTGDGLADLVVAGSDAVPFLVHGKTDTTAALVGTAGVPAIVPTTEGTWYANALVPDLDCDGLADLTMRNGDAGNASQGAVLILLQ